MGIEDRPTTNALTYYSSAYSYSITFPFFEKEKKKTISNSNYMRADDVFLFKNHFYCLLINRDLLLETGKNEIADISIKREKKNIYL